MSERRMRFENRTGAHHKFYEIVVDTTARTLYKKWGRIGSFQKDKTESYVTLGALARAAQETIDKRAEHGYTVTFDSAASTTATPTTITVVENITRTYTIDFSQDLAELS